MKYILVTGGVISGIGKGIIASSVGTILKSCGLHVTAIKIDPYINIDAGTFSPYEHGGLTSCRSYLIYHLMPHSVVPWACDLVSWVVLTEQSLNVSSKRGSVPFCSFVIIVCNALRGSLCSWWRRRSWLGLGELWAFLGHSPYQGQQPHHWKDLPVSHQQGEEGRLLGQNRAGWVRLPRIKYLVLLCCGRWVFAYFLFEKNLSSVVPHITDAIQEWVMKQARVSVDDDDIEPEVCVIEVSWS